MYDREIIQLHLCAALMGFSSFILAALHRFNLLHCTREYLVQQQELLLQQQAHGNKGLSEEDTLRQTLCIVDEVLRLVLSLDTIHIHIYNRKTLSIDSSFKFNLTSFILVQNCCIIFSICQDINFFPSVRTFKIYPSRRPGT